MQTYKMQDREDKVGLPTGLEVNFLVPYQTVDEIKDLLGLSSFNKNFSKMLELNTSLDFVTEGTPKSYISDLLTFLFSDLDFYSQGGKMSRYGCITVGKRELEGSVYLYKKLKETLYLDLSKIEHERRELGGMKIRNSQDCISHIIASNPLREDGIVSNDYSVETDLFAVNCIYELPVKSSFNNYKEEDGKLSKYIFPFTSIIPVVPYTKEDLSTDKEKPKIVSVFKQYIIFDNGYVYVNKEVELSVNDELIKYYQDVLPTPYFEYSNYIVI